MALPINVEDLIHPRKVERTRIEYKADWNPEPIITQSRLLQMILTIWAADMF